MGRTIYVLHSALTPNSVADELRRSIDEEHWTPFSLSGYKGERPLIGEVGENTFRIHKRRNSKNDFAGHFYGKVVTESSGTRIEGYFDAPRWAKYFMKIWLGFAVLIGAPIFSGTVLDMLSGTHYMSDDNWVGLVVPPTLILFGIFLPKVGRLFGKNDERFILEQVQTTLSAHLQDTTN